VDRQVVVGRQSCDRNHIELDASLDAKQSQQLVFQSVIAECIASQMLEIEPLRVSAAGVSPPQSLPCSITALAGAGHCPPRGSFGSLNTKGIDILSVFFINSAKPILYGWKRLANQFDEADNCIACHGFRSVLAIVKVAN
jgi:hypothetical protein